MTLRNGAAGARHPKSSLSNIQQVDKPAFQPQAIYRHALGR
jgi:hypothetical protein